MKNKFGWNADNGDGTYTNPVLYTDYSDPDVCRVGDDYYLVASSFCNAPGLPILHSVDLVNWTLINYAIKKVPGDQFDRPLHGHGVWAPAIRYHNGEFYIFFPMPDEGIYVVKSKDPRGRWEEPYCIKAGKGVIDPCPFWDDDGRAYMVSAFAKSRIGFNSILSLCEMTPDATGLLTDAVPVFDGNTEGQHTIEGPKMYKRNGYYYIFAPAGGVKQGWQEVLRSKSVWGPYEHRTVLVQDTTKINGPHQGALLTDLEGRDWFLHFQDVYAAGRILHLQPVVWKEDWPVIGEPVEGKTYGRPVETAAKPAAGHNERACVAVNDTFENGKPDLMWQWNANEQEGWYETDGRPGLKLLAIPKNAGTLSDMPNLLLQKWAMPEFVCKAELELGGMKEGAVAGMLQFGMEYGALCARRIAQEIQIVLLRGMQQFEKETATATEEEQVVDILTSDTERVVFGIQVTPLESVEMNSEGAYTFPIPRWDTCLFYLDENSKRRDVCHFEAKAGRWVGAKVGVFCHGEETEAGFVRVKSFLFE